MVKICFVHGVHSVVEGSDDERKRNGSDMDRYVCELGRTEGSLNVEAEVEFEDDEVELPVAAEPEGDADDDAEAEYDPLDDPDQDSAADC